MKNLRYIFALTLIIMSGNILAETATITFASRTDDASNDANTAYTTSNFVNDGIASADEAFGTITCTATDRCYKAKTDHGVKVGKASSTTSGNFTISFSSLSNVTKIVLNRASYASDKTATITVKNGETILANAVSTPSGTANFSDMEITDLDIESLSSLTVESSKYCYVKSITITYVANCDTKITITKGAESHGTFTISPVGETCADDPVTVNVTNISPATGYVASIITTSASGTPSAIANGAGSVTGISASTTIGVTFVPKTSATLTKSVLGNTSDMGFVGYFIGDQVTLPGCDVVKQDYVFYGWSTTPFSESEYDSQTIYRAGDKFTLTQATQTLYAVYAVEEGTPIVTFADFTASDNHDTECQFVIAANVNGTYYAMSNNFTDARSGRQTATDITAILDNGTLLPADAANYVVTIEKDGSDYRIKNASYYLIGVSSGTSLAARAFTDYDNYDNRWSISTSAAQNGTYRIKNTRDTRAIAYSSGFGHYSTGNITANSEYHDCEIIPVGTGYNYSGFATRFITYSDFAYKCTYDINYENLSDNPWAQDYVAPSSYDHNLHGEAIPLPTSANLVNGSQFQGWFDNENLEGDPITELAVTDNGDKTVYAAWASVVNFHVQGEIATTQTIDNDGHVAGYTPTATCTGKKFMGWSTVNQTELIQDPASLDLFTAFSDKEFTASTDLYAVYAAYNGGKTTGEVNEKDVFISYASVNSYQNTTPRVYGRWTIYNGGPTDIKDVTDKMGKQAVVLQYNNNEASSSMTAYVQDFVGISANIATTDASVSYTITYSVNNGSSWQYLQEPKTHQYSRQKSLVESTKLPYPVDALVKIEINNATSTGNTYRIYIDDVTIFTNERSYWYSDYSTNCTMAASANLTYAYPKNGGYYYPANPVGETITITNPNYAGYTLDYVEIKGQQYNVGDSYILAHTVEGTAHWTLAPINVDKSDIYVTSTNGVTVQAHDVVTASNSKLTDMELGSLVATSNNAAFAVEVTNGTLSSDYGLQNATITITYTPTAYNITETATISLNMSNDGDGAEPRGTFTVHGRSLPQNFVIATQTKDAEEHDIWVALPANMFSAGVYEGETIELDNEGNALASIQYQYSITGRWETMSADAVRIFSNANNDKHCLYASKSTTNIEDYAKLTSSSPTADNYAWLLETTDLTNYKFKNLGRESNQYLKYSTTGKFGMYANGNDDFRIFPVEVITELGLRIVEWGTDNHVLVSYDYDGVTNDMNILVKVGTPAERAINLSNSRVGSSDLYNLDCSTLFNFGESAGKTIRFKATESTITKEISYTVPFIVTGETTTAALTTNAEMTGTPVVITPGAMLTVNKDATVNNFSEVMIYPAANLSVPSGTTLATSKLTLRGGYDGLNGELFDLPQAFVEGAITQQPVENEDGEVTTPTEPMEIHYQYNIDNAVFYDLAVPYAADIYTITDETGFADFSMWVENYDGAKRVSDGKGWVDYDEWGDDHAPLHVGTGYLAAVKPIHDRPHFMLDIPMSADLRNGEPAKGEFNVTAPGFTDGTMNNGLHANNVGWNFVANPYMTAFSTFESDALNGSLTLQTGELVQEIVNGNWTGHYVYSETNRDVRYVTTYDGEHYVQHPMSETKLMPFTGFFVQVSTAGQLNFNLGSRTLAPAPAMIEETTLPKETELIFTLKSEKEEDNLVLLLGNAFSRTNAYEFMNDQSKVFTGSGLKFYTMEHTEELYANAMQYDEAQYIPVGVRVDVVGEYTFDRLDNDKWDNVESCLIIDTRENNFIDLMKQPYTTQLEKGTNNDRFMLHLAMKVPTSPTSIFGTDDGGGGPQKIIHNSLMYIIMPDGRVYNAAGDQVNGKEVLK